MKFEDMSEEAQEVAKNMIILCIEHGYCMGMDGGYDQDTLEWHPFAKELERFRDS